MSLNQYGANLKKYINNNKNDRIFDSEYKESILAEVNLAEG